MLEEIMRHVKNMFIFPQSNQANTPVHLSIESGVCVSHIGIDELQSGSFVYIEGSHKNDGVRRIWFTPEELEEHQEDDALLVEPLEDEEFDSYVVMLKPPKAFLNLAREIKAFSETNKDSAYTSESFGGYSYSRATNKAGNLAGWQDVFKARLNTWRKM
ncbi:MAG: hypothetical protein KBS54_00810 [Synergistaceae bacterium]|nr:hypothetical protein [Candidatus Equadaptatus faecalis]